MAKAIAPNDSVRRKKKHHEGQTSVTQKASADETIHASTILREDTPAVTTDERFQPQNDPRFRKVPMKLKKLQVDERFSKLLTDTRFQKYTCTDPYGRKNKKQKKKDFPLEDLGKYYAIQTGEGASSVLPVDSKGEDDPALIKEARKIEADQTLMETYQNHESGSSMPKNKMKMPLQKDRKSTTSNQLSTSLAPQLITEVVSAALCSPNSAIQDIEDTLIHTSPYFSSKQNVFAKSNVTNQHLERDVISEDSDESSADEILSDSASENDTEDESEEEVEAVVWQSNAINAPKGEATKRLSIMGCKWHYITAADLLIVLQSFLVRTGRANPTDVLTFGREDRGIERVAIYPSDYGLQMMEREANEGPLFETTTQESSEKVTKEDLTSSLEADTSKQDENEENEEELPATRLREDTYSNIRKLYKTTEEEEALLQEKLREYQAKHANYYYAVVECSSTEIAEQIYDELDGMETEFCLNGMDLRFIPDSIEFPHSPTSVATDVPKNYEPPSILCSSALRHSKVNCTWDEPPAARAKLFSKKYTPKELEQMDVEDFIGSESDFDNSEDETESIKTSDVDTKFLRVDEKNLEDYRKLLLGDLMKDEEVSTDDASPAIKKMQRKISLGEKEKAFLSPIETPASVLTSPHGQTKEENKIVSAEEKHPPKKKKSWKNKNIEETASRRAMENQAELELLMDKDENRHFDMHDPKVYQKNKKKRKNMEENISSFQINTDDSRFSKIFTHSEYTIDPTNPNFKKTQASEQLLQEKRKRRAVSKETAKLRTKKQLNGMNDKMDAETSVHEDVVSDIQIFKPRKKS